MIDTRTLTRSGTITRTLIPNKSPHIAVELEKESALLPRTGGRSMPCIDSHQALGEYDAVYV